MLCSLLSGEFYLWTWWLDKAETILRISCEIALRAQTTPTRHEHFVGPAESGCGRGTTRCACGIAV